MYKNIKNRRTQKNWKRETGRAAAKEKRKEGEELQKKELKSERAYLVVQFRFFISCFPFGTTGGSINSYRNSALQYKSIENQITSK